MPPLATVISMPSPPVRAAGAAGEHRRGDRAPSSPRCRGYNRWSERRRERAGRAGRKRPMREKLLWYIHEVTAPERTRLAWFDLIELGLMAVGFLLYFLVRGGIVDRVGDALEHARWIIDRQRALGIFIEPAINEWALAASWRVRLFNFAYFWLDFPLIITVGLLLFWRSRRHYTLLRDALLISGGFALVLYGAYPVAPPRFLPEWGFVDTLEQFANLSYQAQSMRPFVNPFAAVPSLHVCWALLLAIVLFRATRSWLVRGAGVASLALQAVAVLATSNHYIFDASVGMAVSLPALAAALWLDRDGYPRLRRHLEQRARRLAALHTTRV
ncbi:MAG: phosphatase PAP2 family protein [Dehalococcoidia bacterium]|nr:phosphatase PAP2 family protein [Dehalococcoidia bacterium]